MFDLVFFFFHPFVSWQHITIESYIPCLTDLCKALWEVMLSYYRTMQWHEEHDKQDAAPTPGRSFPHFFIVSTKWLSECNTTSFRLKHGAVLCKNSLKVNNAAMSSHIFLTL